MHRPSDWDVNWMSPVQGESPLVQVKEPYGNFDMVTCRLSSCTHSVQSTPADNTQKRVWQYIEKERKITVCHHSASLVMPSSDSRDGLFYPNLTLMIDSYITPNMFNEYFILYLRCYYIYIYMKNNFSLSCILDAIIYIHEK